MKDVSRWVLFGDGTGERSGRPGYLIQNQQVYEIYREGGKIYTERLSLDPNEVTVVR